jgi:hypothetical protein
MKNNKLKNWVMFIVFLTAFIPFVTHAGTVQLPLTGQKTCYGENGGIISCSGTGQDGDLLVGAVWPANRFIDNGDQTELDNLTGLIWITANWGNIMPSRDLGFDRDGNADDGKVNWQHALDYIKKLNAESYLGHNDWRLPNVIELGSLINAGVSNSAEIFNNVANRSYWSSSTYTSETSKAWVVSSGTGSTNDQDKAGTFYYYVVPVRSEQPGGLYPWRISLPNTGQTNCYNATGGLITCTGTGQDGEFQIGATWPGTRFVYNGGQTVLDNL